MVLAVLDSAAHVFATAQRRLDFPMTIGALGDLHHLAIWQAEIVVLKRCVAMTASCVDGHVALVTGVGSHRLSPVFDQWSDKRCVTIASVNIRILVIRKYNYYEVKTVPICYLHIVGWCKLFQHGNTLRSGLKRTGTFKPLLTVHQKLTW